ncbi:hypothetical protein PMAYCL1PPCAC_00785, partial [Pristionchus mayeri]
LAPLSLSHPGTVFATQLPNMVPAVLVMTPLALPAVVTTSWLVSFIGTPYSQPSGNDTSVSNPPWWTCSSLGRSIGLDYHAAHNT